MQKDNSLYSWRHPFQFAPILMIIMAVLLMLGHFLPVQKYGLLFSCLIMGLFQFVLFGFPLFLYGIVRPEGSVRALFGGRFSVSSVPCVLCATVMLILQSAVLKFGVFYFGYDVGAYSLYGSSFNVSAGSISELFAVVLGYAVIPAIAEEILFRGVMTREYRIGGPVFSALLSSFLFALIHFDPAQFPIYFFAGLVLSGVTFVTGSLAAAMAVHAAYNLFVIFLEQYVWLMSSGPDSELLFWFILIALYLLSAYFFFRLAGTELNHAAQSERRFPSAKIGVLMKDLIPDVLFSPSMICCIVLCAAAMLLFSFV